MCYIIKINVTWTTNGYISNIYKDLAISYSTQIKNAKQFCKIEADKTIKRLLNIGYNYAEIRVVKLVESNTKQCQMDSYL